MKLYLSDCGVATPLGCSKTEVAQRLFKDDASGLTYRDNKWVGAIDVELPTISAPLKHYACRNNQVMQLCLDQIAASVKAAITKHGQSRIAVILGTSTAGISDGEEALAYFHENGAWPKEFLYTQQETSNLAQFAAAYFGITGPVYTVATACSSSAKVFASARRLIQSGIVDAAIVGGTDTLCRITLNGFDSLELLSAEKCNPFSTNRNGISIGEGGAAFLITKDPSPVALLGIGETSDAHHPTAPDPSGQGAQRAMEQALAQAGLAAAEIDYINLHGTASQLNDAMESHAVAAVFGTTTPCSSTKRMTGHTLGAAGAIEAAFLWLTLHPEYNDTQLPPHLWDGIRDPALPPLAFTDTQSRLPNKQKIAMLSNSFGFGGSNASLILGRGFA